MQTPQRKLRAAIKHKLITEPNEVVIHSLKCFTPIICLKKCMEFYSARLHRLFSQNLYSKGFHREVCS